MPIASTRGIHEQRMCANPGVSRPPDWMSRITQMQIRNYVEKCASFRISVELIARIVHLIFLHNLFRFDKSKETIPIQMEIPRIPHLHRT